jgi:Predicted HD superfamily hydrolase
MQRLQLELNQIVDRRIREFTEYVLQNAPDYFWSVPSSSSGKYHPEQSNGEGGLVRHTKAVIYFAVKLCDVFSITGIMKDWILSACILHDIVKYGEVKQSHTTKNHDYEGALFVKKHGEAFGLDAEALTAITSCVAWHMGRWTDMTGRTVSKTFPEGYNTAQMITHLADVISAQKNVSLSHI